MSIDARMGDSLELVPEYVAALKAQGVDLRLLFLDAKNDTLIRRFSETRRRHPLATGTRTLEEALTREREVLAPVGEIGYRLDTTDLLPNTLRNWIKEWLDIRTETTMLLFESFSYKQGVPLDADLVFDVRCLPNPHYDPRLPPLFPSRPRGREAGVGHRIAAARLRRRAHVRRALFGKARPTARVRPRGLVCSGRFRVESSRRHGHLPLHRGHSRGSRRGSLRQSHRARGRRDLEGGPQADSRPARDAVFGPAPGEHAQARARGRGHPPRQSRLLSPPQTRRGPGRFHRRANTRSPRGRARLDAPLGRRTLGWTRTWNRCASRFFRSTRCSSREACFPCGFSKRATWT